MRTNVLVLMAGLMITLIGCSQDPLGPVAGTGRMQINMIDAPAAYDAVNVVVDSVQVHITGEDSVGTWITLNTVPTTYDLLTYVNGNFAIIGAGEVPVGRCSQMRLYVGSGSNVVVDGETHMLTIPSGVQSGVKILVNADVQPGADTEVTIDFDANLSVVQTGPPTNPEYTLNPVIRTKSESSGAIEGTISPSSFRAAIWATNELQESFTTWTDATGGFVLSCLPPGTYTVSVVSESSLYSESEIAGVTVYSASTATVGAVVLAER